MENPDNAIHIRLDGMGRDYTDQPWWIKASKRQRARLPIRLMGALIVHHKVERLGFLITEFTKEVYITHSNFFMMLGEHQCDVPVSNFATHWVEIPQKQKGLHPSGMNTAIRHTCAG